jgi:hypothetical protein
MCKGVLKAFIAISHACGNALVKDEPRVAGHLGCPDAATVSAPTVHREASAKIVVAEILPLALVVASLREGRPA